MIDPQDQVEREIQDMQHVVGRLLQIGVGLSAAVVLLGAAVFLKRHWNEPPTYRSVFKPESPDLNSVSGIVRSAFASGRNMIQLGLVLLIATPIARVAFSVFAFAKERDRLYTAFTILVLGLLAFSLLGL